MVPVTRMVHRKAITKAHGILMARRKETTMVLETQMGHRKETGMVLAMLMACYSVTEMAPERWMERGTARRMEPVIRMEL